MIAAPGRLPGGLGALVLLCVACDASGPRVDAVSPSAAPRGGQVRLDGDGFCGGACETTAGFVVLGLEPPMVRATVTAWTATRIDIVVPAAAPTGATDIIVIVDGSSSNAVSFEVL